METCGDGVNIGVGVAVLVEVESGVLVVGFACLVCIAAAFAVPAMMVDREFESNVLLDSGAESPDMAQARLAIIRDTSHRMDFILNICFLLEIKNSSRLLYAERNKGWLSDFSMQAA